MSSKLSDILQDQQLAELLLNEAQTRGFVTSMAAAPNIIAPTEWLAFLWGGEETSPFSTHEELENYANAIIDILNEARTTLFDNTWQWPEGCALDDSQIVTEATSNFCEGMLQGWQLARDDWETIMPPESEDNALLGGVLLSFSLLFDPETALEALKEQDADALAQFEEIFNAIPVMLCGLTQRGAMLVQD